MAQEENNQAVSLTDLTIDDDYVQYFTLLKQLSIINPEKTTKEEYIIFLEDIYKNPRHKIIVAKLGSTIIGTISILIEPKFIHDRSYVAHIEDVVVDDRYRKLGVGKMLISKAIEISKSYKCYKIILDCNKVCINFYKNCGFQEKDQQMALYLED